MKLLTSLLALAVLFCLSVIPQRCFGKIVMVTAKAAEEAIKKNHITLIKFSTSWCPSCIAMKTIDDAINNKFFNQNNGFRFLTINGDIKNNENFLKKHNILGYPTYIIFKEGTTIKRFVGIQTEQALSSEINKLLTK